MLTLFLVPTQGEAARFRELRADACTAIIGVGMAEAGASAAEAISRYKPQRVVLAGIAGACGERLAVGECVAVVSDMVVALPEAFRVEYQSSACGDLSSAVAYTVSRTGESLPFCGGDNLLPAVEQMEGAAVAAVCRRAGVEYLHLRAISNRVTDSRSEWRIGQAIDALTEQLLAICDKKA